MLVGKLKQNGELLVPGVDTRSPLITDGLVAHYPMDGSVKGRANFNILDYGTWTVGTSGTQSGFSQNGDDNTIISDIDPFGATTPVWRALDNDTTSTADGGWNSSSFSIDNTKKYRFSVWIKRKVLGNGSYYLGCHGYGSTNGVYTGGTGTSLNTNPYFIAGEWGYGLDKWVLFVGHIHPYTNTTVSKDPDSGVYEAFNTTPIGSTSYDFKWHSSSTSANHRSYLYYCTSPGTDQRWCYPRVDVCDGTEPSIEDLVMGEGNVINISSGSNYTLTNEGVAIEEGTINFATNGTLTPTSDARLKSAWIGTTTEAFNSTVGKNIITWNSASNAYVYTNNAVFDSDLGTLSGTTCTASIMIRRVEGPATGRIRLYDTVNGYRYQSINVTKDFQRFSITAAIGANNTRTFFMIDNTGGGTYEFYDLQLEQKAFPTSYVAGTRIGTGQIDVITTIGTSSFTIIGRFIPNANSDTLPNSSYILNLGGGFRLSTYNGQPYIDGNTIAGSGNNNVHIDFNSMTGDEITYIIKRSGTTFTWRMMDSRQDITWTKVHANVAAINVSNITYHGSWGGVHSNLSIYNRVLSDSEVNTIIKGTHKFTKEKLITKSINTTGEIRYIRDYINGSTANTSNHWVEIKANTQDGINVALGKTPTSSIGLSNIAYITDGIVSSSYAGGGGGLAYVQIDLGGMYLIDNIQVWHYYIDGRTYYNTRTQVSHDGIKWYDVFNSDIDGTYQETINGKTHYVGGSGEAAMRANLSGLNIKGINTAVEL